jgi:prephenate dehydratase/prephenate dehydrogenase
LLDNESGELIVTSGDVEVFLAVPDRALFEIMTAIDAAGVNVDMFTVATDHMATTLGIAHQLAVGRPVAGVHLLAEQSVQRASGQTIFLVRDEHAPKSSMWFEELIRRAGAVVKADTARTHDQAMAIVQGLSHRTLIAFADAVTASGLDLERDLWESRTPLFETLLGLSARVLEPRRQSTISRIQQRSSEDESLSRSILRQNNPRLFDEASVSRRIEEIRGRFGSALYSDVRDIAATAIDATQAKRSGLAELLRSGELVGIEQNTRGARLHVGFIVELTSMSVVIDEVMDGPKGKAALTRGAGRQNTARLGVAGRERRTELGLGHINVVKGVELDQQLNEWLAFISRDIRFLVPESVSGRGVLAAVDESSLVRDAALIDQVVRTGQRSVVIRVKIRADKSVEETIEQLLKHVEQIYLWPSGVSRPIRDPGERNIVYLGPAGTFSENAARQLSASAFLDFENVRALASFDDVIREVEHGSIGVLPVTSSSSGLVTRAISALLEAAPSIVAGGVIDVAVRFDAYAQAGRSLEDLRGHPVYSHPQGIAQCQSFIKRWQLNPISVESTAAALELVASNPSGAIALGGVDKGEDFELRVIEREVDDLSGSITRFLVLGREDAFGELERGSEPTQRAAWIGRDIESAFRLMSQSVGGFDELLRDKDGNFFLISSTLSGLRAADSRMRFLGIVPWSPRTPIVRPISD